MGANNIFFTLALGLLTLFLLEKSQKLIKRVFNTKTDLMVILPVTYLIIMIIMGLISSILNFDYGIYGIFVISFFYLFKDRYILLFLSLTIVTLLLQDFLQLFSLISLVFIYFYNKKEGKKCKLFFYLYYPVHILVLGLIHIFI